MGLHPSLRPQGDGPKYDNVLFSAPPSGSEDYVSEVPPSETSSSLPRRSLACSWATGLSSARFFVTQGEVSVGQVDWQRQLCVHRKQQRSCSECVGHLLDAGTVCVTPRNVTCSLQATGDADEDSPLKPVGESGQTDRLLLSEMAVLEVLRIPPARATIRCSRRGRAAQGRAAFSLSTDASV